MGAREKLNAAYISGSLVLAALVGAMTESWTVFFMTAVILLALNVHSGDIRPRKHW